MSRKVVTI